MRARLVRVVLDQLVALLQQIVCCTVIVVLCTPLQIIHSMHGLFVHGNGKNFSMHLKPVVSLILFMAHLNPMDSCGDPPKGLRLGEGVIERTGKSRNKVNVFMAILYINTT